MTPITNVLSAGLLLILLTGCGTIGGAFKKPTEKYRQKTHYTYVENRSELSNPAHGLLIGKVDIDPSRAVGSIGRTVTNYYGTDANAGSMFKIYRVEGGQEVPVDFKVEFVYQRRYGIIPLGKAVSRVQTSDVFAGNIPTNRSRDFKNMGSGGAFLSDLFLGTTKTKRGITYFTQFPTGWFIVQLPPGEYVLKNLEHEYSEMREDRFRNTSTITTRTFRVGNGPQIHVEGGQINYMGNYRYFMTSESAFDVEQTHTPDIARQIVQAEFKRQRVTNFNWSIP
jgi:hypothetical protein